MSDLNKIERLLERQASQLHSLNKEIRDANLTLEEIHSTLFELLEKKSPKENKRPIHKTK